MQMLEGIVMVGMIIFAISIVGIISMPFIVLIIVGWIMCNVVRLFFEKEDEAEFDIRYY